MKASEALLVFETVVRSRLALGEYEIEQIVSTAKTYAESSTREGQLAVLEQLIAIADLQKLLEELFALRRRIKGGE